MLQDLMSFWERDDNKDVYKKRWGIFEEREKQAHV